MGHELGLQNNRIDELEEVIYDRCVILDSVLRYGGAEESGDLLEEVIGTSKDVEDMIAEWEALAATASSQEEHLAISASGTWSTAVEVGGLSMMGESSWSSQRFRNVEGILWEVGKSLGVNSLSQGFLTAGGGHCEDEDPALGCWLCWYRRLVSWIGGYWRWSFSCFFLS